MTRQRLLILLSAVISLVFLALAFQGLKPQALLDSLADVYLPLVALATALFFASVAVISLRWQFLLNPVARLPLMRLFQLVCIGYMGNNLYPLRAGEALRIVLLRRDEGVPIFRSTTITIVERVFDGVVMLSFILFGIWAGHVENEVLNAVVRAATPLFVAGLVVLFLSALIPRRMQALVEQLTRPLSARPARVISHLSAELLRGLAALQDVGQLAGAVLASYGTWLIQGLVYYVMMLAFGLDLPFSVALLVVGAVNLAGLIPASPGQIGVYQYFVLLVLQAAGVSQPQALSYAIVTHIVIWLPATVAGLIYLFQRGLSLGSVPQTVREQQEAAQLS